MNRIPQLKTRATTAVLFVVLVLGALVYNRWTYFLLFSIIHFGCWFEFFRLVERYDAQQGKFTRLQQFLISVLGWCGLLLFAGPSFLVRDISLSAFGNWFGLIFILVLPVTVFLFSSPWGLRSLLYVIFGWSYLSLPCSIMMHFYDDTQLTIQDHSFQWPPWGMAILVIFSIWLSDTFAYLVGSWLGRTPLSSISPKKTWEGVVGGWVMSAVIIGLVCQWVQSLQPLLQPIIWMNTAVSITGTAGDLLESKMKRMAGVKDSGSFMPGHGGFLDRFDALLLAIPVAGLIFHGVLLRYI